ncbi:hypothetical protein BDZ89DRAFT_1045254 [Hymenopellis radicata]|nr:hypothetical protein BDZ89DRAFT_1045254 [Hymenopellis radicata]
MSLSRPPTMVGDRALAPRRTLIHGYTEMTLWRDERDDESLTPLLWTTPCFEGGRLKERVYLEWTPSSYPSWEGDDEDSVALTRVPLNLKPGSINAMLLLSRCISVPRTTPWRSAQ